VKPTKLLLVFLLFTLMVSSAWGKIDALRIQPGGEEAQAEAVDKGWPGGDLFPNHDPDFTIINLTNNSYDNTDGFPNGYYMKYPCFNSDGTKIAVAATDGTELTGYPGNRVYEIWIMDYDPVTQTVSNFQQVTTTGNFGDPGGDVVWNNMCSWSLTDPDLLMFLEVHFSNPNIIKTYSVSGNSFAALYDPSLDSNGDDVTNPGFYGTNNDMCVFGSGYNTGNDRILLYDGTYPSTQISPNDKNLDPSSSYDGTRVTYYSTQATYADGSIYSDYVGGSWITRPDGFGDPTVVDVPGYWAFYSGKSGNMIVALLAENHWTATGLGLFSAAGTQVSNLLGDGGTDFQWAYGNHNWKGPNGEIMFRAEEYTHTGYGNNVFIAFGKPSVVYVDDDWTGPENCGGMAWGYNAFATIQDGVNGVAEGGTVNVNNGLYTESNILVDRGCSIIGESRTGVVVAPAAEDPNDADNSLTWTTGAQMGFIVDAANVSIEILTIDGEGNPALTPDKNNYRVGVITQDGMSYENITVEDVTISSMYYRGIYLSLTGTGCTINNCDINETEFAVYNAYGILAIGNAIITNNSLSNIGGRAIGTAFGDITVRDNDIDGAYTGLYNYNWGYTDLNVVYAGNNVTGVLTGMNLVGLTSNTVIGGPNAADRNTIDIADTKKRTYSGIETMSIGLDGEIPQNQIDFGKAANDIGCFLWWTIQPAVIENNEFICSDADAGMWVFHCEDTLNFPTIRNNVFTSTASDGTVIGEGTGIFLTDDGTFFGDENGTTYAAIEGNQISGFARGIDFYRNAATPAEGRAVEAPVDANSINSCGVGVQTNGGFIKSFENNFVTGCSGDGVLITTGLVDGTIGAMFDNNLSGNGGYGLNNATGNMIDASGNWWGSNDATSVLAELSGNTDYSPWLDTGGDSDADNSNGFQGEFAGLWVDDNSPVAGTEQHIQEGVNLLTTGTVNILAGTYIEQVYISGKDVSLVGAGKDITNIVSPPNLTDFFNTGSNDNYPVVYIENADGDVEGLTVDGDGQGNSNYRFVGIGFWNAGGSVVDVHITGVRDSVFSGAQHGVSIYAYNNTGGPYDIVVSGVNIDDMQKTGIALMGDGLTTIISNCQVQGNGITDVTAQNGIQVGYGADATITDCDIDGIAWDGPDWVASGILCYLADNVDINGTCNVTNAQACIYIQGTNGSVEGASVSAADIAAAEGITIRDYAYNKGNVNDVAYREAQPLIEDYQDNYTKGAPTSVSVNNVSLTGKAVTETYGLAVWSLGDDVTVTLDNSEITNWDYGLVIYESGSVASLTAHGNSVFNNAAYAGWANTAAIQDCESNYWGEFSCSDVTALFDGNIDFDPWCNDDFSYCTFTCGAIPEVWVDDDWAGSADGDEVMPGKFFGYNAFDIVADGVAAVGAGGTVHIMNGLYYVNAVQIDKAMTVDGETESGVILAPEVVDINGFEYAVGSVTISNMTFDGSANTALGAGNHFVGGIVPASGISADNVSVSQVTVKYVQNYGISLANPDWPLATGMSITNCTVEEISNYYGIRLKFANGTMSNNTITGAPYAGIANIYGNAEVHDNEVNDCPFISIITYTDFNNPTNKGSMNCTGNTVNNAYYGIVVQGDGVVDNNTVNVGMDNGIGIWSASDLYTYGVSNDITFTGNTVNMTGLTTLGFNMTNTTAGSIVGGAANEDRNEVYVPTDAKKDGSVSSAKLNGIGQPEQKLTASTVKDAKTASSTGILVWWIPSGGSLDITNNLFSCQGNATGVWLYRNPADGIPYVYGNDVVSSSASAADIAEGVGVIITDDGSYVGEGGGNSYGEVYENNVTGFINSIVLYRNHGDTVMADVYGNDLSGFTNKAILNSTGYMVNAYGNWYGDTDPTNVAAAVSDSIDYTPWLGLGTEDPTTGSEPGFQGDFSDLWVDDDSPQLGAVERIQEGVNLVTASTVHIAAGTYTEQVYISGKDVTLIGAGKDVTNIISPADMTNFFNSGSSDNYPIIFVENADGDVENLTVDGDGQGDSNYRFVGIGFWNAGGSVTDVHITRVRNATFSGAQHGVSIYAYNNTGGPYEISVSGVNIDDMQKTGIALMGDGLTTTISNCQVQGNGITDVTAQNGIQIAYGASATITDCDIDGIAWDGPDWVASGILCYLAGNVDIDGTCNVTNAQSCIYMQGTNGSVEGAVVSAANIDAAEGITIRDYGYNKSDVDGFAYREPSPLVEDYADDYSKGAPSTVAVNNVTLTGAEVTETYGLAVWSLGDDVTVTLDNSTITNWDYGLVVYESGSVASLTAHTNSIYDNVSYGGWANTAATQDCEENYWGLVGCADVTALFDGNIDFDPWCNDDFSFCGFSCQPLAEVWVDDDWVGSLDGDLVDVGKYFGFNAFYRIRDGVNAVGDNGTVHVYDGNYEMPIDAEGRNGITVQGESTLGTIFQPSIHISWAIPGYPQYDSRKTAIRTVGSEDIVFDKMTMDFDLIKGDNITGALYWNSTGTISNCVLKNMSASGYYEMTTYLRAPDYTSTDRAQVNLLNNTFEKTGRLAVNVHDYVNVLIEDNSFDQVVDDFGYAIEVGSASTGIIRNNTFANYDTWAASDQSASGAIYIENAFTSGITTPMPKNVLVEQNEIHHCQYGVIVGNEFEGYAGNVDINATIKKNYIHDNSASESQASGAILLTDEGKDLGSTVTASIDSNEVENNGDYGIYAYTNGNGSLSAWVRQNWIADHYTGIVIKDYGEPSSSSYDFVVHHNIFDNYLNADNDEDPGYWDDNVDHGNCWSDYSGSQGDPYPIPGNAGASDRYPNLSCGAVCDCEPGDADGDQATNLLDITHLINYLYKQGPIPEPYAVCSGDPNADCAVNLLDITYLINYLYKDGPIPVECEGWGYECGWGIHKRELKHTTPGEPRTDVPELNSAESYR